ncbi:MAG: ribosomal protein S18-alanine N-acetyltransferase [Ornithinimicrobium sp.]|uniref:ribosomal protein S18-alanine N-acetyltransferase n=1 Tax=Ornithinimicrobium sp. TaxID=1977084 RepID=UPI0026DF6793|nr:ribosomal protein S18-alanine N-acetyltransferase [Ornithinimicrobium sp.]MDO5738870.1 ribosomal protein S18-alanine N-acetyltransferase [Ornithinimicrobium sp.]
MRLREARWQDLAAMAALESRCFPHDAWPEQTFWAELAGRPRRGYWVALAAGPNASDEGMGEKVVGYAGLDVSGEVADVMTLAVDPRQRGAGVGAALLQTLHTAGRHRGALAMMLEVRADNRAARCLYDAHGYATIHTRSDYYRTSAGPWVDALIMRKELR